MCPSNYPKGVFYLQPLPKPKQSCWYSVKPIGQHTLNIMVKDMCRCGGIQGYKMNHSLRTTTATRLFRAGCDKQLIMERTGHRSLDRVRSYKRSSDEQHLALSEIVNGLLKPATLTANQQLQMTGTAPGVSLQNCSNITINICAQSK